MHPTPALVILLLIGCLTSSCKRSGAPTTTGPYKFDTVTFRDSGSAPSPSGPEPSIYIDTHTKVSGMAGGTVESRKPYSIAIDYTDETFTFARAEFTKVTVTYADGTEDPGAAGLKLPLRIKARPYEAINSVSGGRIVKTRLRVISGRIAGAITRDMPFKLRLEGMLVKEDGSEIPFAIEREYDVETDRSTKPWGEVMQDL